ncbi:helix-turn-helix domain-containing protein [Bradyrhizobium sp. B120]|uniref:helix-turn-helix domain-containing protein n=1 Tax=Bradyrhizobium sp. B120 TaxID=3410088 RepID=UPI003B980CB0
MTMRVESITTIKAAAKRSEFFVRKLKWHDALSDRFARDRIALAVAMTIGKYLNSGTGKAFPSRETIANRCDVCVRSVERAVNRLERRGFLIVQRARGRGHSNVYSMAFPKEGGDIELTGRERTRAGAASLSQKGDIETGPIAIEHNIPVAYNRPKGDTSVAPEPQKGDTGVALTLIDEDSNLDGFSLARSALASARPTDHEIDQVFEELFWRAYPKRVGAHGKPEALKKFRTIVRSGEDAGKIIKVAERLREHWQRRLRRKPEDGRFIPMASTWLTKRRWNDELGEAAEELTMFDLALSLSQHVRACELSGGYAL